VFSTGCAVAVAWTVILMVKLLQRLAVAVEDLAVALAQRGSSW
jgi:hypothetical protein